MATDEGSSLNRPYNLGPPNSFVAPPTDLPSSAPTIGLLQIPVVQPTFINFSNNCLMPGRSLVSSSNDLMTIGSTQWLPSTGGRQFNYLTQDPCTNSEEPISEEEAKRRRELLARRPSYRKILNDLSGYELEIKPKLDTCTPEQPGDALGVVNSSGPTAVHSSVILPSSMPDGIADTTPLRHIDGDVPAILAIFDQFMKKQRRSTAAAAAAAAATALRLADLLVGNGSLDSGSLMSHGATSGLLHYAQTTDGNGQILLPSTFVRGDVCRGVKLEPYDFAAVSGDLLGLKPVSSSSALSAPAARSAGAAAAAAALVNQGLLPAFTPPSDVNCSSPSKSSSSTPNPSGPEEAVRKRELRLLKNREAAKECRRKKKEYVKCLESRVTVLETQNKQLIEELKNLKELYCQKAD
ncbi:Cyclic AMP-responsive element-binding protein 1 [Trichinella pseudospiralis]|uniref:Cyclic AMP-responsive element-binding protein 1 n=2 Tax=Trichinella pseudospiralis TaxID=6337 RepID=A0A0V1I2W4_TRIPS|nr:Cyclic AMP-responsive element-binding protein 1 [Trichinella pseudospiralis]KRZ17230.1 Cyclic AMP-responsive element-binding protein 1 [Trichinella pseudospiralis]KRZ40530.1 Cyclic AMP-responsive element-binding protein 1 [Trichinella pseudospiralis]